MEELWKLWKRKWRSSRRNLERKVKVRLVQAAVHRSRRQKTRFASNRKASLRRPAKVGWFGYGNLKVLQPLKSGVLSFNVKSYPRTWKALQSLTAKQTNTWTAVERALTDRFHPKETRQVHISTLRAKLRRPDEDLHQLRCDTSRLVELAYLDDPSDILDRTARDFFVGALTPIISREKTLDLGPNTLDEALAAAQRYESNQKVLNKASARALPSTSVEQEKFGSQ